MTSARWTGPAVVLRAEDAGLLALVLVLYGQSGGSWLLFAALILAPDLAMLGYRAGNAPGALVYNLAHTLLLPAALAAYGFLAGPPLALWLGLIWLAHVAADRVLGFGLKYAGGFQDTHLNRV